MGIIKIHNDKKWILQFLDALYNSIDMDPLKNNWWFSYCRPLGIQGDC
jgi:hypothetical protein